MNKVFIGGIGGFKRYTAEIYDKKNNKLLYKHTFLTNSLKSAKKVTENMLSELNPYWDRKVKIKVSRA